MKLYKANTSNAQVYTTKEKGHFCGFIDSTGYFSVVPNRFQNKSNAPQNVGFIVRCKKTINGSEVELPNNSTSSVGCKLKFSIESFGGLIEPFNKVSVFWEVSNGGKNTDYEHQEIYNKGKNETDGLLSFSRDLSFKGIHLLRCTVVNTHKGLYCSQIYKVTGV